MRSDSDATSRGQHPLVQIYDADRLVGVIITRDGWFEAVTAAGEYLGAFETRAAARRAFPSSDGAAS
jgi:hypothetical protein